MSCPDSKLILKALEASHQLKLLADENEGVQRDDGCAVLLGIIRDCAYKIRGRAEQEREAHKLRGAWDMAGTPDSWETTIGA